MPFSPELPPAFITLAAELGVRPEDIEHRFIRGSGHGGQKINKTESTVQMQHLPTGITVKVQQFREQSKNRTAAEKLLILKIEELVKGRQSQIQQEAFKRRKQKMRRSRKSKEKMLQEKRHQSDIKEGRRPLL